MAAVRVLSADDALWAAAVMEQRRLEYAAYSPVFWRPAKNAIELHAQYLRGLISSQITIALRTDNGFIICQLRKIEGLVDDFAVRQPGSWSADGAALLLAVAEQLRMTGHPAELRVVTAHADQSKADMLASLSLRLVEQWWVRELRPPTAPAMPGRITESGYSGLFGPAPPVYDPRRDTPSDSARRRTRFRPGTDRPDSMKLRCR